MRSREKDVLHVHLTQTGRPQTRLLARLPLFTVIFHRAGKLCRLFLLLKFRYCISAKNQLYWQKKDCAAARTLIRHVQCAGKADGKYRKYEGDTSVGNNYTYILKCRDGSLYTGWTNDLERRIREHNAGKGAKYTKTRRPVTLAYFEKFDTKEEAMSREYAIKRLKRKDKLKLVDSDDNPVGCA